jgi:hypothetical protein
MVYFYSGKGLIVIGAYFHTEQERETEIVTIGSSQSPFYQKYLEAEITSLCFEKYCRRNGGKLIAV